MRVEFIITETLQLEDGRCILRLLSERNGEWVVRLPPVEYQPKFRDEAKIDTMRCLIWLKDGPAIDIGHEWWVNSGTAVGAPLDRFIEDYRSRPEDIEWPL